MAVGVAGVLRLVVQTIGCVLGNVLCEVRSGLGYLFPITASKSGFMLTSSSAAFHDFLVAMVFDRNYRILCNRPGLRRYDSPKLGRQVPTLGRSTVSLNQSWAFVRRLSWMT